MSENVEYGTKSEADAVREEYADYLCSDDDRRLKTVEFTFDIPEDVLRDVETRAAASRAEDEAGPGQATLTDAERDSFDFARDGLNVPKLRAIKGIAVAEGVDDWRAYVDPDLTVDEHREVMEQAAKDESGARADVEESDDKRIARQRRQRKSSECDHAEDHCRHGDPDACEFLQERCGFSDDQVERILDEREVEGDDDLPGEVYGALSQLWTQYRAGLGNAKKAAAAINEVRQQHGQDPLTFDELGERAITKENLS